MQNAGIVLAVIIVASLAVLISGRAIDEQTCYRVINQSQQGYKDFFVSKEEAAACDRFGLEIPANIPVR